MSDPISPVPDLVVNRPHQFSYENGIVITRVTPGLCEGVLTAGPSSINPHGTIHGGALATLADTVAGVCACSEGGSCVTATSSMEYLRPATGARIFCRATPKKLGHTLSVIQFSMTDDHDAVVATGTFTYRMLWNAPETAVPFPGAKKS